MAEAVNGRDGGFGGAMPSAVSSAAFAAAARPTTAAAQRGQLEGELMYLRAQAAAACAADGPPPPHERVMHRLAENLSLDFERDVFSGTAVETALVSACGHTVDQTGSTFARVTDGEHAGATRFWLRRITPAVRRALYAHYGDTKPGFVREEGAYSAAEQTLQLVVDTRMLLDPGIFAMSWLSETEG